MRTTSSIHTFALRRIGWPVAFGVMALSMLLFGGCHRAHYRQQADAEAYALVREKVNNPHWMLPRISIDVDPRSRMFDPYDPDREPMPPDDPASHVYMHRVGGKPNYPHWGQDGFTSDVENPGWVQCLPVDQDGVLRLDLATTVQLSLLHSPDYQEEFEDLYLSALDVSAERFRFDSQWFGGSSVFYRTSGRDNGGPRSRLSIDSDLAVQKAYITGADLVVNLANSLIWDFHGPNTNVAMSLLDFSFVQPLLRGAGRDRVLTRLTLSERQLLANVRQMERFRRGFYMELATGDGRTFGPRRIGGLFGGSGLEGFTGVGGGFGGVGTVFTGAGGAEAAGLALQVGGFMGLLQDQQNIRNQKSNIAGLRTSLVQFQQTLSENLLQIPDDPTEVIINRLQVAQTRQTLYNQEFALATAQAQYQAQVDDLKVEVGLPPRLCVEIVDPLLDQFNLVDPALVPVENEISNLSQLVGLVNEQILASVQYENVDGGRTTTLQWSDELAARLRMLSRYLTKIKSVRTRFTTINIQSAKHDVEQLRLVLPQREESLRRLREKFPRILEAQHAREVICQTRLPIDVDPFVLDVTRLDGLAEELEAEINRLRTQLQSYAELVTLIETGLQVILSEGADMPPPRLYTRLEQEVIFAIPGLLARLNSDLLDLKLVQARARADSINLLPIDLPMFQAVRIASENRRDWMNARASLVDTWRAIAFVANDLESVLDLVVDGELGTVGDNPVKFRSTTGSLRMGVRFDAPFTRLLERNNYRQVLIDYQQARRGYYQFVDRVSQQLRDNIRSADLNELNFETRRVAVLSAITQVVLNDEIQTLNEERGQAQGVTAARDTVQALSDLQDAQDAFMGVWITYEVNRRFLDYNLGTMQLDEFGVWIDPGKIQFGQAPYVTYSDCPNPMLAPSDQPWPSGVAGDKVSRRDATEEHDLIVGQDMSSWFPLRAAQPPEPLPAVNGQR